MYALGEIDLFPAVDGNGLFAPSAGPGYITGSVDDFAAPPSTVYSMVNVPSNNEFGLDGVLKTIGDFAKTATGVYTAIDHASENSSLARLLANQRQTQGGAASIDPMTIALIAGVAIVAIMVIA